MLSYALTLLRNTSVKQRSNGGDTVKSQWIGGVALTANESKTEVVSITVPADMLVAIPVVQGLSYTTQ